MENPIIEKGIPLPEDQRSMTSLSVCSDGGRRFDLLCS